jgi:pyruvate-formate lyase-activating enzyme
MVNLNNFICTNPFSYTEIMEDRQTFCCPQWLEEYIEGENIDYKESWHSDKAQKIRESMIDGSFKYCSTEKCPHLSTLVNTGHLPRGPIKMKNKELIAKLQNEAAIGPKQIKFIFDQACNLACPSCRNTFIRNSESIYVNSNTKLEKLSKAYSDSVEYISMSGAGDPFYSQTFFEFLQNVDIKRFPNLKNIHLHTNAILWNEFNWKKIKNSHNFIKSTEISIDAATKETYKIVRKGGNFDILTRNLNFIKNLEGINNFIFSFVVQKENYTELVKFYEYIKSIFDDKLKQGIVSVTFTKVQNWGNLSQSEYDDMAIWQPKHPEHSLFINEVNKLMKLKSPHIITNLL